MQVISQFLTMDYKQEHEQFVAGLKGSSMTEVATLLLMLPVRHSVVDAPFLAPQSQTLRFTQVCLLFQRQMNACLFGINSKSKSATTKFIVDFATTIVPMLICCTVGFVLFLFVSPIMQTAFFPSGMKLVTTSFYPLLRWVSFLDLFCLQSGECIRLYHNAYLLTLVYSK